MDNRASIREAFAHWVKGDRAPFLKLLDDDVRWTLIGSTPISGVYQNKQAFLNKALNRIGQWFTDSRTSRIVDVSADGDKVFLEWESAIATKTSKTYNQTYCWVLTMRSGRIVEATAYLDTEAITALWTDGDLDVVARYLDYVSELDMENALALATDDLLIELPFQSDGPQVYEGEEAREFVRGLPERFKQMKFYDMVVHGKTGTGFVVVEFKSDRILMSGEPSPKTYIALLEVRDGKIARLREFFKPNLPGAG